MTPRSCFAMSLQPSALWRFLSLALVPFLLLATSPIAWAAPTVTLRPRNARQDGDVAEALLNPTNATPLPPGALSGDQGGSGAPQASAAAPKDTGKTWLVATAVGRDIQPHERKRIDSLVGNNIRDAFTRDLALRFGPDSPPLYLAFGPEEERAKVQTDDEKLAQRAQIVYDALLADAGEYREAFAGQRLVLLATNGHPALYTTKKNDLHLIGSAGNYPWQGEEKDTAGSHYAKLALFELAKEALTSEEAQAFRHEWVAQHVLELRAGGYVEDVERTRRLNDAYEKIRLLSVEKARQRELKQAVWEIANVRLGLHVVTTGIPDVATAAVTRVLSEAKARGDIVAFRLLPAYDDLQIQVNHHQGTDNPAIQHLIATASRAALAAAAEEKILKLSSTALLTASELELAKGLHLRRGALPMTERGAEPTIVVKAINGGAGTFNRALFRAFTHPDVAVAMRLAREKFRFVVERADDIRQGKKDRVRYSFSGTAHMAELLALIGDHSEWVITEVYAEAGRFVTSSPGELVAKVMVEPVDAAGFTDQPANPTLIVRLQSGSMATGVLTAALADPYVAPGGANDAYHLVTMPVSWKRGEANQSPARGYIYLVGTAMSPYGDGRIPREDEVLDLFDPRAEASVGFLAELWRANGLPPRQAVFTAYQDKARRMANFMLGHGDVDPFLTARGAEALSEKTVEATQDLWVEIPKTEKSVAEGGDVDEVVRRANAASEGRTFSVIKADAGGNTGHLIPPIYFSVAAEASQAIMGEEGLIDSYQDSYQHFPVGDDYETLSVHRRGADSHDIHKRSYAIFWRMVYLADNYDLVEGQVKPVPAKTYGKAQDLVSEEAKKIPVPRLAALDDQTIERMAAILRSVGKEDHAKALEAGYRIYQADVAAGKAIATAQAPFSGNITGQGPGFAEMPLPPEGATRLAFIGSDKTGPAAFNIPILWTLEQALARRLITKVGGAIAVIADTKRHKYIFLDVETQMDLIRGLAANPDQYNFKRVISKSKSGWDRANWREYVGDRFFIATSTEKLSIITGGEYRGKDDSVLIAAEDFGELVFEHARDHRYFTQGDGYGSHMADVRPELLQTAVATAQSKPIQIGLWADISADNKLTLTEVFNTPAYEAARKESVDITELLWAQNGAEFTPVGVGARRVEQSYPLMKTIRKVTDPGSEWARPTRVDAGQAVVRGRWAELNGVSYQTSAQVARQVADVRHPTLAVISLDAVKNDPSLLIATQQLFEQTYKAAGFASPKDAAQNGGIKLVLHVAQTGVPAEADALVDKALADAKEATDGAITLDRSWFAGVSAKDVLYSTTVHGVVREAIGSPTLIRTVVVGSQQFGEKAIRTLAAGTRVDADASRLGEKATLELAMEAFTAAGAPKPLQVRVEPSESADSVASAGAGFLAALETAAAPDRQPPQTAVKQLDIKVSESHVGLIIAPKPQTVPELTEPLAHYRTTVGGV